MDIKLKLSPAMQNEWQTRCIGDVVPALADWDGSLSLTVTEQTAREIAADCEFYINPKAVDATVGERSAYRCLLRQVQKALA
jgi:hypothetical protein